MSPRYTLLASLFTLLASAPAAQPSCPSSSAAATLDAGEVRAVVYPNGNLFWRGSGSQYEVPAGSRIYAIFSSTLWVGGTVGGQPRFSGSTYGPWEFRPGALDADGQPPADCAAHDRIWHVSLEDVAAYNATGTATPDLAEWPASLGAPVLDGDGDPDNYRLGRGDRPDLQGAAQTAWWVMNDLGGTHDNTGSAPIGLEVRVQAFAFVPDGGDVPEVVDESTFYEYTVIYQGEGTLDEFYLSLWLDPDVGDPADDYVGSRPDARLGYAYNASDTDAQYGPTPPAVGVYGIGATSGDLGALGGGPFFARGGGERSPVSSLMYFINGPPSPQSDPGNAAEVYNYLRARWNDGTRLTFGASGYDPINGVPTAFAFPGDAPDYWSENDALAADGPQPNQPGDRRSLQNFGPYTLETGQAVQLLTGILWARADDGGALASLDALVVAAAALNDGGPDEPEPIFGNTLVARTVETPSNVPATLVLPLSNPGGAELSYTLAPGDGPGSPFLALPDGEQTLAAGGDAPVEVVVDPAGAAAGTYLAEILVTSNDRNVVTAAIPVTITVAPPVDAEEEAAGTFALRAPSPNPAAGRVHVEYQLAQAGPARLTVVDALGREVAVVVDEAKAAGAHDAWLPLDALPSGVYVVRLQAGDREATHQLTVVR